MNAREEIPDVFNRDQPVVQVPNTDKEIIDTNTRKCISGPGEEEDITVQEAGLTLVIAEGTGNDSRLRYQA